MSEESRTYRNGRLIQTLFKVLEQNPDGLQAKIAISEVRDRTTLHPTEEGSFEKTGEEKFPRLIRFATIPPTKVGWMTKNSGTWSVNSEGLEALASFPDPEKFFEHARSLYNSQKKSLPATDKTTADDEDEISAATTLEDEEDAARAEILEYLGTMPPFDFQTVCAKLVDALGHEVTWISPPGPDGGLDFVAYADPIGATGRRIKGQAKRHQDKQGPDSVKAFLANLKGDDVGVFIALGGFTKAAEEVARVDERRLVLLDGPDLIRLWIENYENLDGEALALLSLKPVWHLVPDL